jgi:putative transposase
VTTTCVFDDPINGKCFRFQALSPRDIVVMDNLGSHKAQATKDAIERAGAKLIFLPPPGRHRGRLYNPDLYPIEQAFSKIKSVLRKARAELSRQLKLQSLMSSRPSRQPNAATTSETLVTPQPKWIRV